MKTFLGYLYSKTFEQSVSRGTMIMKYHTSRGSTHLTYTLNFMYMQRNSNMHNMKGLHLVILISHSNYLQIPLTLQKELMHQKEDLSYPKKKYLIDIIQAVF